MTDSLYNKLSRMANKVNRFLGNFGLGSLLLGPIGLLMTEHQYHVDQRKDIYKSMGVDAYAGDKFKFSADVYDASDPSVRLRAQYRLGNSDTWLLGQMNDVNDSEHRATYVGIRQSF